MRRTGVLLAGAAAVLATVATGCGASGGGGQGASAPASSSPTHTSTSPTQPTAGPTGSTSPSKPAGTPTSTRIDTTLTGTAVRGVEPGCVGIKTKGKTYQLSGDAARALAKNGGEGQELGRIKVSGHFAPKGMASFCMMGDIFVAVKLKKL